MSKFSWLKQTKAITQIKTKTSLNRRQKNVLPRNRCKKAKLFIRLCEFDWQSESKFRLYTFIVQECVCVCAHCSVINSAGSHCDVVARIRKNFSKSRRCQVHTNKVLIFKTQAKNTNIHTYEYVYITHIHTYLCRFRYKARTFEAWFFFEFFIFKTAQILTRFYRITVITGQPASDLPLFAPQ